MAWLVFPLVPAALGNGYQNTFNALFGREGPDPWAWGWLAWILMTGPLLGYGFLAGVTLDLPDPTGRRGWRGWLGRRWLWVAVGPWLGFLAWAGVFFVLAALESWLARAFPQGRELVARAGSGPPETWVGVLVSYTLFAGRLGSYAYGWLPLAVAALVRARRSGQFRRAFRRGLAGALGFVGSLFGTFWAITQAWRAYFFDTRIVPIVIAGASVALVAGCATPVTYGEVRRRELFQALLMAWLLGLALAWRWWSRPRSR
jgi:hypothetical protein